jgi:hypothetical protein
VLVIVSFPNATATTTCHAPGKNGNEAPGQNPAARVSVTGTKDLGDPKNGVIRFEVTTLEPAAPSAEEAGCPNTNWTVTINDVIFGSGTITFKQFDSATGDYVTVIGPTSVTL